MSLKNKTPEELIELHSQAVISYHAESHEGELWRQREAIEQEMIARMGQVIQTELLTIEKAAALAGGDLKPYVLKNLCQHAPGNGFYPAKRMPGEGGRGRRIFIHRELFKQWLRELGEGEKQMKQEKKAS
jgi:hypothetical protein